MNSTYENLYAYHLQQKYYQDTSNVFIIIVIIFFIVIIIFFIIFIFIHYFYCWSLLTTPCLTTPCLTGPEASLSSASSCCLPLVTTPCLLKPQANLSVLQLFSNAHNTILAQTLHNFLGAFFCTYTFGEPKFRSQVYTKHVST